LLRSLFRDASDDRFQAKRVFVRNAVNWGDCGPPAEQADLDERMAAYDTAIEKIRGSARQAGSGPYGLADLAASRIS